MRAECFLFLSAYRYRVLENRKSELRFQHITSTPFQQLFYPVNLEQKKEVIENLMCMLSGLKNCIFLEISHQIIKQYCQWITLT